MKCAVCGAEFATRDPRKKYCSYSCRLAAQNSRLAERYNRLKAGGICVYCGKSRAAGGVSCRECKAYHNEMDRMNYRSRKEAGNRVRMD